MKKFLPLATLLVGCYPSAEQAFLAEAQKAVADRMKDPASTQFRDVSYIDNGEWLAVACGEANAKNGFGAYAGFTRFISTEGLAFFESDPFGEMTVNGMAIATFDDFWGRVCLDTPIAPRIVNTERATLLEYESLMEGISLEEAQAAIGAPGHLLARSVDADGETLVQQWNNSDGSTMSITFENDKFVRKAQKGLD